jgi:hypothetical protein
MTENATELAKALKVEHLSGYYIKKLRIIAVLSIQKQVNTKVMMIV